MAWRSEEMELTGGPDRLPPPGDAELPEDPVCMGLDSVERDIEIGRDLLIGHQAGQIPQYGVLSLGEVIDQLWHGDRHLGRLGGRLQQLVEVGPRGRNPLAIAGKQRPGGCADVKKTAAKAPMLGEAQGTL